MECPFFHVYYFLLLSVFLTGAQDTISSHVLPIYLSYTKKMYLSLFFLFTIFFAFLSFLAGAHDTISSHVPPIYLSYSKKTYCSHYSYSLYSFFLSFFLAGAHTWQILFFVFLFFSGSMYLHCSERIDCSYFFIFNISFFRGTGVKAAEHKHYFPHIFSSILDKIYRALLSINIFFLAISYSGRHFLLFLLCFTSMRRKSFLSSFLSSETSFSSSTFDLFF